MSVKIRLTGVLTLLLTLPGISGSGPLPLVAPPVQAQSLTPAVIAQSPSSAITVYQPLQSIQWEGTYVNPQGIAYLGLEPIEQTSASESDLEAARALADHPKEARIWVRLGLQRYLDGNFDAAIAAYKQSLEIAKAINDREVEGIALGSLGLAYAEKGFYTADTIAYLQDYLAFTQAQSHFFSADRRAEAMALGNLGNAYFGSDLYVNAIKTHQQRLALSRSIHDQPGEAKALGDLSLVYQALGETRKAIELQEQQLAIARRTNDTRNQSMALANLGIAYHTLGDYHRAADYQQQRLALATQTRDRKAMAEALVNLAGAYYFQGDAAKAIDTYEQAWTITWETLHDADILYGLRGNEALAYMQQGNLAKAQALFQQYFQYVSSRQNRRGQGVVKNNAAVLQWRSGNLPATASALRESIGFWESLRGRLGSNDAYKVSIFETQNAPYLNLQSVLLAQNQPEAALEIAERGRARAFVELLAGRSPVATSLPSSPNLAQIQQIARSHHATLVEYSILSETFNVQNTLQTRESALLIWVVQPTGEITFRRRDLRALWQSQRTLADLVTSSRDTLGVRGRGIAIASRTGVRAPADSRQLQTLHELLIQPIVDRLPTDPNALVIIVPQRSLFFVPFAALQNAQGQYLIQQHTLAIAPSIQVLDLTRQHRIQQAKSETLGHALIVGNPTMPVVSLAAGQPPEQLPSLPGAEQEARTIAALLHTQPLIGNQATKAAVVQQMSQASLVHLATHGLLDDFRGLGVPGAIALAPAGKDDGLLTASDMLNLKLNAALVVLSACNTGQGTLTGDGVIGLSRSLLAAGTPSVVVSLWSVPDAPTAALMSEFYRQLSSRPNKAQALRQAMLTTLQQYPDPINWAAFTLIGEAE